MKIHEQSSILFIVVACPICPLKFFESICVEIFHDLFLKFCAFKNFEKKKLESSNILKCKQIYLEIFESKHNFHYSILFNLYSDKIKLNKASHLQVCSLFPGMTYLEIPGRNSLVVKRINEKQQTLDAFFRRFYLRSECLSFFFFFFKKKLNALFE